jgi:asparagine synthase (glutamine-hydrolysing)
MAFSIEARLPFLDSRLVRFAHSLRSSDLVRGGSTKWIFRQAACPLIPDLVRKRSDKVGFGAPDKQWFVGAGYAFAREVLLDGATARSGYVNMAATARLLEKHRSGTIDASGPLWRLLNVALWHRELVTRFGYPAIG